MTFYKENRLAQSKPREYVTAEPKGAEIYNAIRYLEPNSEGSEKRAHASIFVIGINLLILLLCCIGLVWLHQWTR